MSFIFRQFNVGITCQATDNPSGSKMMDSGVYRLSNISMCTCTHTYFVNLFFRPGYVVLELPNLAGGSYTISPSTFYPGQEGPFILTVFTDCVMS